MINQQDKKFYRSVLPILNWQPDDWEYKDVAFGQIAFRLRLPPFEAQAQDCRFAIAIIQLPTDFKIGGEIYVFQGRHLNKQWIREEYFDIARRDDNLSKDDLIRRLYDVGNNKLSVLLEKIRKQEQDLCSE